MNLNLKTKIYLKQIFKLFFFCTPNYLKRVIYKKRQDEQMKKQLHIFHKYKVSHKEVIDALEQLEFNSDILIHSSLIDIGDVKGGHKSFIKYLNDKILDNGYTILSIAIPVKGSTYDYLDSISSFSREAPNGMGVFTKFYLKLQNSYRSLNPTHSIVALGNKSLYYTQDHHFDETPFAINSPYYKMLLQNASVLMIGCEIKHLTICHLIEDMMGDKFPFDVYSKKKFPIKIIKDNEIIYNGVYKAHSPLISAIRVSDYINDKILELDSTKRVKIGHSELIMLNVRDVVLSMLNELIEGWTIYGYRKVSEDCKEYARYWITKIKEMDRS